MKQPSLEGVCRLCNRTMTKSTMTRHLRSCAAAHEPPRGRKRQLFHLIVEGYGTYWLHVEMPGDATFAALDKFLRGIWLECCGHMSAFRMDRDTMGRLDLDDDSSLDLEFPEDALMDYEISEVLAPKLAFDYEYDFGSTTQLRLKVAGVREGAWAGKKGVRLLARNLPPPEVCNHCGRPARWIDQEQDAFLCDDCSKNASEPELLLPVVNSPRMGVCGYTGEDGETP